MPLGKDAYEKALGRKLSDAEYAKLSGAASGATSRAPGAYAGAGTIAARGAAPGSTSSMDEERARTAKLASPAYTYETPNGAVRLWSKNPAEVDAYVQAGQIDATTGESIKKHLATQGPQPMAGGIAARTEVDYADGSKKFPKGSGYSAYSSAAFGDEMSAAETGKNAAIKAADKDAKGKPLQALVSKAPAPVLDKAPTQGKGPGTPLFQAVTAPPPVAPPIAYDMGTTNKPTTLANKVAPPEKTNVTLDGPGAPNRTYSETTLGASYPPGAAPKPAGGVADGMTNEPESDYAAIIGGARKKWGL